MRVWEGGVRAYEGVGGCVRVVQQCARVCSHSAVKLSSCCPGTVPALPSLCTHTILTYPLKPPSHCPHTALNGPHTVHGRCALQ